MSLGTVVMSGRELLGPGRKQPALPGSGRDCGYREPFLYPVHARPCAGQGAQRESWATGSEECGWGAGPSSHHDGCITVGIGVLRDQSQGHAQWKQLGVPEARAMTGFEGYVAGKLGSGESGGLDL